MAVFKDNLISLPPSGPLVCQLLPSCATSLASLLALLACLLARLFACLLANLLACLLACLLVFLLTCLSKVSDFISFAHLRYYPHLPWQTNYLRQTNNGSNAYYSTRHGSLERWIINAMHCTCKNVRIVG